MKNLNKLLPSILFFGFICALILVADVKGTEFLLNRVPKIPFGDKLGHFVLFGVLALLLNHALTFKTWKLHHFKMLIGSSIIGSFAVFEELTQIFLSTRSFDLLDMLADFAGIYAFTWFYLTIRFGYKSFRSKN